MSAVDQKRCLAARSDAVEGRHPPTERPGRKARCGRWQLAIGTARPQGGAHVRGLAGSVSEPTHGWWCYWRRFAVCRPGRWQAIRNRGGEGAACPFRCPDVIEWSPRP